MTRKTAAERASAEWRGCLAEFESDEHWIRWRENISLRTLLHRLHAALQSTPENVLQEFDNFEERALANQARLLMSDLAAGQGFVSAETDGDALFRAAVVLRAVDELLLEGAENIIDEAPEAWLTADGEAYVVPVPRSVMAEGGPRTRQSFSRRGLLHHRVVPTRIGDVDVVIEPHPDLTAGANRERTFGAALFLGFQLTYQKIGAKHFVVTEVDCADGIQVVVDRHCSSARASNCDTLIWPELTMNPNRVEQVQVQLSNAPLLSALPPIVVVGSWHVPVKKRHQNLAVVLDGRGELLFTFGKSRRFTFNGLSENIDVYGKVHIVATDYELIAFAICKDFCDKARAVPITSLDVDLVLVPSMGQPNTMTAHRDAADDMKVLFGTRSAVVQQSYPVNGKDPPGYVLRVPKEPRAAELSALEERQEFTTFQRE